MQEVILEINKGLVDAVQIPNGIKVVVRDYDVDVYDDNRLDTDEEGKKYIETIHE